jgi:HPt (histidine-containing phosphotransfer) domain-containing protein
MSDHSFETHFAGLRDRFSTRLYDYQEMLHRARTSFVRTPGHEAVRDLKRISHELAGAAGTFGFPEIGDAALALEQACDAVLEEVQDCTAILAPLRRLVRELEVWL